MINHYPVTKIKKTDSPENSQGWQIIYTGVALILLCFFIMLSSYASVDKSRMNMFRDSFMTTTDVSGNAAKQKAEKTATEKSFAPADPKSELAVIYEKLQKHIKEQGLVNDVTLVFTGKGLVMTLQDKTLFNLGVASISSDGIPLLKNLAEVIAKTHSQISIVGHTDNLPIHTREFPSNWELSTMRAVNVLRFFIDEGIQKNRLSAVGSGEFKPIVPNDNPENRAKNRRVEIIFKTKELQE